MSNLVALKREPDAAVIALIEELLERAKRGEIIAVAVAAQLPDASTSSAYELGSDGDVAHLTMAMERVKLRLLSIE